MTTLLPPPPALAPAYGAAFPCSTKVYLEGSRGVRVPVREIALSGGEPPLRVYDTSWPEGVDVHEGLRRCDAPGFWPATSSSWPGGPTSTPTASSIAPAFPTASSGRCTGGGARSPSSNTPAWRDHAGDGARRAARGRSTPSSSATRSRAAG